jgi:hypothetical protein
MLGQAARPDGAQCCEVLRLLGDSEEALDFAALGARRRQALFGNPQGFSELSRSAV